MLDCYYCKDSADTPESPNEENYVGSFELNYFKLLQEIVDYAKKLNVNMHFFEDFRIHDQDIIKLHEFSVAKQKDIDSSEMMKKDAYKRMSAVLKAAKDKKVGLVFFCD